MEHEVFTKLRAEMKRQGFDALVALTPDNVTYTAGVLIPSHVVNRFRRTISILAGENFSAQIVVNVEENLALDFQTSILIISLLKTLPICWQIYWKMPV